LSTSHLPPLAHPLPGSLSLGLPPSQAPAAARPVALPVDKPANDPINIWLILAACGYLAMSYFAFVPSIWVRMLLACVLILRMKPDIIIPYCLCCMQLKLMFAWQGDGLIDSGDVTAGLTGFESYSFAVPTILISVRAAFAAVSSRVDRRGFPWWLYGLWLVVAIPVIVGAFVNMGTGRGWTGGMRMYSIVGGIFYGLLLPRMSPRQTDRLAAGLAVITAVYSVIGLVTRFGSKIGFILGPIGASWAIAGLLPPTAPVAAVAMLALTGFTSLFRGTKMVFMTWVWCVLAGVIEAVMRADWRRPRGLLALYVVSTAIACATLFSVAITRQVNEKQQFDTSFWGQLEMKLLADRGPIWWGGLCIVVDEPSLFPTPERPFMINWFGVEQLWPNGPHNLVLELMNQLGTVAGPMSVLVMAYVVCSSVRALSRDRGRGVRALLTAAICSILVGGLTLPYVVGDRLGEITLFTAGAALASSWAMQEAARRQAAMPT
jgi:hypothetical protein